MSTYSGRDFILQLVGTNSDALYRIRQSFINDPEVVLKAIEHDPSIFENYASPWLKNDPVFVRQALLAHHGVAKYLRNHSLFQDRDFILQYVKTGGESLRYIPRRWRRDRDIILEAVKHGASYDTIPGTFHRDMEIMMKAVVHNIHALELIPRILRSRDMMCKAISIDGKAYRYVPKYLRNDKDLAMMASFTFHSTIESTSRRLKSDMDLALMCSTMLYVSDRCVDHPLLILKSLEWTNGRNPSGRISTSFMIQYSAL